MQGTMWVLERNRPVQEVTAVTGCCGSNKMKSLAVTDVRVTDGGQGKASEGQETD